MTIRCRHQSRSGRVECQVVDLLFKRKLTQQLSAVGVPDAHRIYLRDGRHAPAVPGKVDVQHQRAVSAQDGRRAGAVEGPQPYGSVATAGCQPAVDG